LSNDGITKAYELLARHVPDYDMVCVIVNDQTYGGTGGAIAVVTTNASAAISTVHEFGHSFFNLADEYSEAFTITPREMPNITADTVRERVKWNAWIDSVTPLPTPVEPRYTKSVGLFEGAMYQTSGWYRPMLNCMMRSLRHPFCKVCLESHIAKIYEFVSPIAGSYPERDTCTFNGENEMLLVKTVHLDTNTISVQWKVNGTLIINNSDTLKLLNISLQKGTNRVTAIVQDTTGDVRIPENLSLLKDSTCWVVHYDPVNNRIETMRNNSIPEFYYADKTVKVSYKSDFSIELVNLSGVSFTKMKCNDQGILDTRFIPSGVYIISIGNHRTRVTRRILLK
jgi:hypothetical protein